MSVGLALAGVAGGVDGLLAGVVGAGVVLGDVGVDIDGVLGAAGVDAAGCATGADCCGSVVVCSAGAV